MDESNIVHETGAFWVLRDETGYHAMISGITHSTCDSSYAEVSLAIARVDYLTRRAAQAAAVDHEKKALR
jgi:hypothetical protein